MRNSCKFARDWHAKLSAFASKNTCNLQAKIHAIADNLPSHSGLNSPANCRQVSLHPASEVTRNLRAFLGAVVCILSEVFAAYKQVILPVFKGKLHVMQVNCVWGIFTCVAPHVKFLTSAGNVAVSENHH